MAFARPVDESLLHQFIVPAHDCSWDDSVVVGCPSRDQRIELRNDQCLWSGLQLLQPVLNGSQVTLARLLAGADNRLHPLRSKPARERGNDGLAPRRMSLSTLAPGDVLSWLLANTEPQEIKACLSLIGRQRVCETCFVGMQV